METPFSPDIQKIKKNIGIIAKIKYCLSPQENFKNIGVIAKIKYCLSAQYLMNIYYSLIFPYLSYCSIVWRSNYKSYFKHLSRPTLHRSIIRSICGLHLYVSTKTSFHLLHLVTPENAKLIVIKFNYLCSAFTIVYYQSLWKTPLPWIQKNSKIHPYNTTTSYHYR